MNNPTTTISNYENSQVLNRYIKEHSTSQADAETAFEELKKFLFVCNVASEPCAPSKSIDKIWHEFILHTSDYADFCEEIGDFVHHDPSDKEEVNAYENTRNLIAEYFGEINEEYWPAQSMAAAPCSGKCKSGTCAGGGKKKEEKSSDKPSKEKSKDSDTKKKEEKKSK